MNIRKHEKTHQETNITKHKQHKETQTKKSTNKETQA